MWVKQNAICPPVSISSRKKRKKAWRTAMVRKGVESHGQTKAGRNGKWRKESEKERQKKQNRKQQKAPKNMLVDSYETF